MAGLESILGGFAQGFGQARMNKSQREKDKELVDLQKQQIKLQMKEKETEILEKKRNSEWEALIRQSPKFLKLLGINPGAGEAAQTPYTEASTSEGPKMGKSMGGEGVTDMISMMQVNPMMAEMYKKYTGIDVPGAIRTEVSQEGLGVRKRQADISQEGLNLRRDQYNRGFSETKIENIPTPGGGSKTVEMPKFGGSSGNVRLLGEKPPQTDFEERVSKGVTQRRVINKTTKEPIGKWREVSGKKGMSGESAGKLGMVQSGLSDLKLAKDILMPGGEVNKKRIFEMSMPGGGMPKSEGREAKAYLLNAMEGKIRIESGAAVPDQEMARLALRFMPSLLDSDELVKAKLNRLESYLNGVVEKLDPNKIYPAGTEMIAAESGEQLAWVPAGGGKTKMPDPLGIR